MRVRSVVGPTGRHRSGASAMTPTVRRLTLACAAGVGIVVLQAAGVATTAQASTAPAGAAAKDLTARSGMAITFNGGAAPAAPAENGSHTSVVTPFAPVKKDNLIEGLDSDLAPIIGDDDEDDDDELLGLGQLADIAEPGEGSPHGQGSVLSLFGEPHSDGAKSGGDPQDMSGSLAGFLVLGERP